MGICTESNRTNKNNENNIITVQMKAANSSSKYFSNTLVSKDSLVLDNNVIVSDAHQNLDDIYEKVKLLGEGAYGEVWLVKHKISGKDFALKIIEKGPYSHEKRIYNEVEILKKLDHEYILKILEFHSTLRKYYIVTDYCPEGELFHYIKKKERFPKGKLHLFYIKFSVQ